MTSLADGLPTPPQPDGAWYAKIAVDALDFATPLEVTIPAFDDNLRFTNCRWQSRNQIDLPNRGDECLVIFDDRRQPWIIAWWPY